MSKPIEELTTEIVIAGIQNSVLGFTTTDAIVESFETIYNNIVKVYNK